MIRRVRRPGLAAPSLLAALLLALLSALAGCSSSPADPNDGSPPPTSPLPTSPPLTSPPPTSPAPTSPGPAPPTASAPALARWQPRPGTPWQWQLSGTVDTSVDVPVYDIDGFENGADVVRRLHAAGRKVICYVNAGAWESFRPDQRAFPAAVRGKGDGWDGEHWLDIRQVDVLRPLMAARFDMCRAKGFDAVEPDLLDGYANTTGFPLTGAQQLAYNRMIAGLAHDRGLAVGLKNDVDQVPALVGDFDFAVNEQCAQFEECEELTPFIAAGKPVFHVEYNLTTRQFCPLARKLGLSSMVKHLDLDAWREPC